VSATTKEIQIPMAVANRARSLLVPCTKTVEK
jgi:hypothetical protein